MVGIIVLAVAVFVAGVAVDVVLFSIAVGFVVSFRVVAGDIVDVDGDAAASVVVVVVGNVLIFVVDVNGIIPCVVVVGVILLFCVICSSSKLEEDGNKINLVETTPVRNEIDDVGWISRFVDLMIVWFSEILKNIEIGEDVY